MPLTFRAQQDRSPLRGHRDYPEMQTFMRLLSNKRISETCAGINDLFDEEDIEVVKIE